jgi:hypothetical protein
MNASVSALSHPANRTCFWLPGGVDALRVNPSANPAARVVDVYSIGRRYEDIHREMLKAAERGEIFCVRDTHVGGPLTEVYDRRQHLEVFANIAKRSRYFVIARAKAGLPGETQGLVEIGYQYFEGTAAGAVMIGDVPDCDAYRELFGWPDAVNRIKPDGSDTMAVLSELSSNLERMPAISRRNLKEALLRHDWVHRWNEMFRIAGIEPSPHKAAREQCLKDLADSSASADQGLNWPYRTVDSPNEA